MVTRVLHGLVAAILFVWIAGCGGSNEPVNKDKDVPMHPKKDKGK